MSHRPPLRLAATLLTACSWSLLLTLPCKAVDPAAPKKIVLIAGRKSHGPEGNGIHDYPWSVRLLKVLFERSNIRDQVRVDMHFEGWPKDERALDDAESVVLISDGRDGSIGEEAPHLATEARQKKMESLIQKGCGLVTFHFSIFAPEAFEQRVLQWSGGFFQWQTAGQRKWHSAIRVAEDELRLPNPEHPVVRGVRPFRMRDEFYYNLRFATEGVNVSPLLEVPILPGRNPDGRWVAWATDRSDGGRSFATSCGHFYDNWKNESFRKLMLNAIAWTAKIEIPQQGIESAYVERDHLAAALQSSKGQSLAPASQP